jgi:enterochelin esterase-like enzyme
MRTVFGALFFISLSYSQSFTSFVSSLERTAEPKRNDDVQRYISRVRTFPVVERDSVLHFVYYGRAGSVLLNGNLQRWNDPDTMHRIDCGGNSFFYRTYVLPSDARLDYQFMVDGSVQLDPLNPNVTPSGFGPHSEVRMPKFVPSPYRVPDDSVPRGTFAEVDLFRYLNPPLSRYTIFRRQIKVYLPHGYEELSDLPVVYINDGFDAISFADMPTILDNLIAQKKIVPVIAVFIPPVARQYEYLTDGREKFVTVLCNEVVPMIDNLFRTARAPEKRAMMGISNGGHVTLYTVLSRPDLFHNAGGQSSTISPELMDLTRRQSGKNALPPTMKIYLDCGRYDIQRYNPVWGDIDFLDSNRKYSEMLASLRIPHFFREVNDGHEWANWRERMPDILIFFFGRFL